MPCTRTDGRMDREPKSGATRRSAGSIGASGLLRWSRYTWATARKAECHDLPSGIEEGGANARTRTRASTAGNGSDFGLASKRGSGAGPTATRREPRDRSTSQRSGHPSVCTHWLSCLPENSSSKAAGAERHRPGETRLSQALVMLGAKLPGVVTPDTSAGSGLQP